MTVIKRRTVELLMDEGIELSASLSLGECKITKKYLLERIGIGSGSVIMIAVPYVSDDYGIGNISEYAKSRDYHLFFKELFSRLIPRLIDEFPTHRFVGFADHSPIDEKHAAALCGLGIIGQNSLLITPQYSSFVFLGEIITDAVIESDAGEVKYCQNCGLCKTACPLSGDPTVSCLSAITQKKGELSLDERRVMMRSGTVWGCDICQRVCPHTKEAIKNGTLFTHIPFFSEKRVPYLTYDLISNMSDSDFSQRAYSWRGKQTVLRNLECTDTEN